MDKKEIDVAIQKFMHPTVFTGVMPLFLVAEELATQERMGDVIDAVWVHWDDEEGREFSYITKFAVKGKILDRGLNTKEEMAPFKGRLALPNNDNLEKMILHRELKEEVEAVKAKRHALAGYLEKDFDDVNDLLKKGKELCFFKQAFGDWVDPFYEIDIDTPYVIVETEGSCLDDGECMLKHPKTGVVKKYTLKNVFHAYIVGPRAEIAGLQLKDESYKQKISALKEEARELLAGIEWLSLKDPRVKAITEKLPRHPFEDYFKYVKKGDEHKVDAPDDVINALELIIAKHMPKLKGPMGIHYIPIDNLLYLFHEVIPRADALLALEVCDIVYEPSALVLGFEGKHEVPPKFLVSIPQVANAYKKFPGFMEACERYLREEK